MKRTNTAAALREQRRSALYATVAIAVLLGLGTPALAEGTPPTSESTRLLSGNVQIDHSIALSKLSVAPGTKVTAPDGHDVTLTVNGIERDIVPGDYSGKIALTVTPDMPVTFMKLPPHHFRTALLVEGGGVKRDQSVLSAIRQGDISDSGAHDLDIRSEGRNFNGVLVKGKGTTYTLDHPRIDMTGNGGDDFAGFGAALMADDGAHLVINDGDIRTHGAVRPALFVGGNATVDINDTRIETRNGVLPSDYKFTFELGKMKQAPWQLGISGNARAQMLGSGTVHYRRSHIISEGWGALSTDYPASNIHLIVDDSLIETRKSGYGAFSIGDAQEVFRNSVFRVADAGLLMGAHGSAHFTDGTQVHSRRFGVMMFTYPRSGMLRIDGGSSFDTAETGIQVKGCGADIIIDDATIHPGNGILMQAMEDDNPWQPGTPKPGTPYTTPPADPNVYLSIRNSDLTGDIINSRTKQGDLQVRLEQAVIRGRISTAEQAPAEAGAPGPDAPRRIGAVTNHFAPRQDAHGLTLSLDMGSTWVVTGVSYLNALNIEPGAKLVTPDGTPASVTLEGKIVDPRRPASYVGDITVSAEGPGDQAQNLGH